jgi:GPN-loop GTPase
LLSRYNLGPNGGILTALNLFTTKFDQVLGFIEKRAETVEYVVLSLSCLFSTRPTTDDASLTPYFFLSSHVLVDTPGQIEIFTWSASGSIITDAIASSLPTCIAYVIDTPRTTAPATFMSNMLYACSILYKTKLPFVLVFNKTDAQDHTFALEWMRDFEVFQEALQTRDKEARDGEPSYMNGLMNSMSLVLDEFYKNLRVIIE